MSTPHPSAPPGARERVRVVGIGASAGGLHALEGLLRGLPTDSGLAFVVVQHLSSTHPTLLTQILERCTRMPVQQAEHNLLVQANRVYTIPPDKGLVLAGNHLHLQEKATEGGSRLAIDDFFRSLASAQGSDAIAIVLSGSGMDGTLGCQAVVEAGGYTLVQQPEEAEYASMPDSVVKAGHASAVACLEEMPALLMHHQAEDPVERSAGFDDILQALHTATGHDFSHYKRSTIERRIERRMGINRMGDQAHYVQYLKDHPDELPLLFDELLINVTSFFRDPEAFEALKERVLRPVLENKPDGYVFRAWVAGCATGEEAYSLAMLLQELRSELRRSFGIQLYATDLDADAIAHARAGRYALSAAQQMSPERLQAGFVLDDNGYRVRSELRKLVVFAVHNVVSDPPFTRLDLLCCRNLLIYLGPRLQQQVMPAFHYALKPKGVLFLSPSESIGQHATLFTPLDRRWKLYQAEKTARPALLMGSGPRERAPERPGKAAEAAHKAPRPVNVGDLTGRLLLQAYVPTSVATDLRGNILYVHGDTGDYLRPAPGQATLNVIEMAREGLQADLRAAIHTAASSDGLVPVRRRIHLGAEGGGKTLDLSVRHLGSISEAEPLLLVSFEPITDEQAGPKAASSPLTVAETAQVAELERALAHTRENLQATIDELQISNEEFCSTNEELQSANEELQSTNEELETSREELQSVNEELITVNTELQAKVEQLFDMQNDMKNLLDSVNIGAIFLDMRLCIRRFTREAASIYRLIPKDLGRSLGDITSHLVDADLITPAQEVLDNLIPYECEVRTRHDHWFLARIMPYRTLDNVIEGVVLTFHDITSRVAIERSVEAARSLAEAVVNTVREPLLVLNPALVVLSASHSYCEAFHTSPAHTVGRPLLELGHGEWNISELKTKLRSIVEHNTSFIDFPVRQRFTGVGLLDLRLDARRVVGDGIRPDLILLSMQINRRSLRGHDEESTATS